MSIIYRQGEHCPVCFKRVDAFVWDANHLVPGGSPDPNQLRHSPWAGATLYPCLHHADRVIAPGNRPAYPPAIPG
jgi:hypothetical protein